MDDSGLESQVTETNIFSFEKKLILNKMKNFDQLPVPDIHIMELMQLLKEEEVDIHEVVDKIMHDQSLIAQVLKLVNSGFYGLRKTIDSIDAAVSLLGLKNIKQIIYSSALLSVFTKDEQYEWDHAYSSSCLADAIIKECNINVSQHFSLAVLLHDIGKLALRRFVPKKYDMALIKSKETNTPMLELEEHLLKITHVEAAEVLLEKWKVIDDIRNIVSHHHSNKIPREFLTETALIQFINWVDCTARTIPVYPPAEEVMLSANLNLDFDYWHNYQLTLIEGNENIVNTASMDKNTSTQVIPKIQ